MTTTQLALYVIAALVLLVGAAVDDARFSVTRCIALALSLLVLAQIVPK